MALTESPKTIPTKTRSIGATRTRREQRLIRCGILVVVTAGAETDTKRSSDRHKRHHRHHDEEAGHHHHHRRKHHRLRKIRDGFANADSTTIAIGTAAVVLVLGGAYWAITWINKNF
ncbi:hypothetical protein JCM3765_004499 [Sporobolomyces pararoseus]